MQVQSSPNTLPYFRAVELFPYQPDLSEEERVEIEQTIAAQQSLLKEEHILWTEMTQKLKSLLLHPLLLWALLMVFCFSALILSKEMERKLISSSHTQAKSYR